MPEKTVAILNLSKVGRKYHVRGQEKGKDKEGNPIYESLVILADQKSVEVPESAAEFLLSKNANGGARYPELIDASQFHPELSQQKEAALAENAELLKENAELKAKLQDAGLLEEEEAEGEEGAKGKKGGKKK